MKIDDIISRAYSLSRLLLICGIFCFIGIFNLPNWYYVALKLLVLITGIILYYYEERTGKIENKFWGTFALLMTFVFPALYALDIEKSTWQLLDFIVGTLFMIKSFKTKNQV